MRQETTLAIFDEAYQSQKHWILSKNGIVFFHMICYSVNMVIIAYFMKNIRIILCYINKLYVREGD